MLFLFIFLFLKVLVCMYLVLQEGGIDASEYQKLFEKNQELQREVLQLSGEAMELRFEVEAARKDVPRMKVCCTFSILTPVVFLFVCFWVFLFFFSFNLWLCDKTFE